MSALSAESHVEPSAPTRPLSRKTLFYYGLADMPIQMAMIPVAAFIPNYYGADLGLSLGAVGTIWLLTRLFDPLIGWLSDRTNTRWGRRRVWMVASVPISMLAVYQLFMPEPPVTAAYLFGWLIALWVGWTMLFIPYYAWAAELSPDYNERTRITGWRAWIGMAANVISKVVPVLAIVLFAYGGTRETLLIIGTLTLVLLPVTVGLTVMNVPESRNYLPTRAAWYFAVWSFTTKVGQSIGPWLALTILSLVEYDAAPGATNSAGGLLGLKLLRTRHRLLYGGADCLEPPAHRSTPPRNSRQIGGCP